MLLFMRSAQYPIATIITFVIVAVIGFAYHEFAHAIVADRLGDPTPRSFGRITLNPIPHLDRTGLILLLIVGFGFAYTTVKPRNFSGHIRVSHAIVAIAGPLTNLLLATLFGLPILLGLVTEQPPGPVLPSVYSFLAFGVFFNLLLFTFNMLPVPPLDGFTILLGVLPAEMALQLRPLQQYGFMIFILIFFVLPLVGIDVFSLFFIPVWRFFNPILLSGSTIFL